MGNRNFKPFPILTTERLKLRQLQVDYENEIFILRSDREINKYLDRPLTKKIEEVRNFIHTINENVHNNASLYWAITLRDSHTFVGTICLYGFSDENEYCEMGYELLTNFQGQGIMMEAVEKVIDYAFNTIKVQKIEAFFRRDNQRSLKLLKKLSFRDSKKTEKTNPDLLTYHLTNSMNRLS